MKKSSSLLKTIKEYSTQFWLLNIMQMFERLAFWIALLQMPIYIAQKDVPGGLNWGQDTKGIIFFWWALIQNLFPVITAGYADRYGYKKTLVISFIIIIIGYIIIATQTQFSFFLSGIMVLGFGSAIFKPTIQGAISQSIENKNQSVGWGIYTMLINLAVFFGPPAAIFLKEKSWQWVFLGSALLFSTNLIIIIFFKDLKIENKIIENPVLIFKRTFKNLFNPKISVFVILMAGFTMIYMQFYETLPNFIVDWIDTSQIVKDLKLPEYLLQNTNRGVMVAYEWLYNLNALFIIFGVVFITKLFSKIKILTIIQTGIIIATIGLTLCITSRYGYWLIAGFLVYTFGEILTNPRFTEYMSRLSNKNEKALYMGYLNISWAIGLGAGSLLGGWLYKNIAEKSSLVLRYLNENDISTKGISLNESFKYFLHITNLNPYQGTKLLWDLYSPYQFWYVFGIIGISSGFGLYFYSKKYNNDNEIN
jgi:proton-dependent oligopeptide transporter, POT family